MGAVALGSGARAGVQVAVAAVAARPTGQVRLAGGLFAGAVFERAGSLQAPTRLALVDPAVAQAAEQLGAGTRDACAQDGEADPFPSCQLAFVARLEGWLVAQPLPGAQRRLLGELSGVLEPLPGRLGQPVRVVAELAMERPGVGAGA